MRNLFCYFVVALFLLSCDLLGPDKSTTVAFDSTGLELNNGVLYLNGTKFTGKVYSNSNIRKETNYEKGRKNGLDKRWFPDGSLASERYYSNGLKTGLHRSWWENNKLKFEYHFNDQGQYHGSITEWYQNGQLAKQFHYINGQEDGPQKLFNPDGKIKANYEVVDGERFGLIGLKKCMTVTNAELEGS
ncbi:MAG: hypothetical protein JXR07_05745 [Reichenbachiella sp.]